MRRLFAVLGLIVAVGACGSEAKKKDHGSSADVVAKPADGSAKARATAGSPSALVLGVEHPRAFNFVYGKGAKAFAKAQKLAKAAAKPGADSKAWIAVRDACSIVTELDPNHLDAQFLLARAQVELGVAAEVVAPLRLALTADYLAYAGALAESPWSEFLASPEGGVAAAVVKTISQTYLDRARAGVFIVARRTRFKQPKPKAKLQWAASRAELYAYDRDSKRFLRITHTNHSLAGWIAAPSGDELTFVSYSSVQTPAVDGAPTLIGRAKVGVISFDSLRLEGKLAAVKGIVRRIRVGYRPGDEIVVVTAAADGRWRSGTTKSYVLDRGKSRLKKSTASLGGVDTLQVDFDRVAIERQPADGVQADSEASSFRLPRTNATVTLPAGELVGTGGYMWSPDKVHLVVRTLALPCEQQFESTLYLVDAATGKLKNLLRGRASFETRWIDNDHFIYEDDEGALRIYDVEERTQVGRLVEKGGLTLIGTAAGSGAVCTDPGDSDAASDPIDVDSKTDDETGDTTSDASLTPQ